MIVLGSDHGGYDLKCEILDFLKANNYEYLDIGSYDKSSVDYPIYAKKVSEYVLENEGSRGILICGTGIGISIAANRFKGIRAALCHDVFSAKATREHNDANILVMGGRVVGAGLAIEIVNTFLTTKFSNEQRHIDRIDLIEG